MNLFRNTIALALLAASASTSYATEIAGVRTIDVVSPQRGRTLDVTVWYPARSGGESTSVGNNLFFVGTPAFRNAPHAQGRYPLVVMSHGSGSSAERMAWLATALAEDGFIVAVPNHPGTMSGDSTPAATPKLWERTQDLSNVITVMTSNPEWSAAIDASNVGIVGFSIGGATAMELSGARANLEAYASYCDRYSQWDCAWYSGGVGYVNGARVDVEPLDLRGIDKVKFEQSNHDIRIKSAVLIDPSLAQAYEETSLKEIAIPMSFINLGDQGEIPPGVIAEKLAALTPGSTIRYVSGANHYSFLSECKFGAGLALKLTGDPDPICDDGDKPRDMVHAEISEMVLEALRPTLKSGGATQ
jgi:predicted dienelactone hydrolase